MEGHYPASRGKRNVEKDQRSGPEGAEIEIEQRENDQQRQRDSHDQSSTGALQLLELPAPGNGISGRQCDLPVDQTLGFRNESSEIAAADVRLDADAALRVFPADLGGPAEALSAGAPGCGLRKPSAEHTGQGGRTSSVPMSIQMSNALFRFAKEHQPR